MNMNSSDSGESSFKYSNSSYSFHSKRKRNASMEDIGCGKEIESQDESEYNDECTNEIESSKRSSKSSKQKGSSMFHLHSNWTEVKRIELIATKFIVNRVLKLICLNDQENISIQKLSIASDHMSSSSSAQCSNIASSCCATTSLTANKKMLLKFVINLVESLRNWRSNYELHVYQEKQWNMDNAPKIASSPPTRYPYEFKPFPAFRRSEGIRSLFMAFVYIERGDLIHRLSCHFKVGKGEKEFLSTPIQILFVCMLISTKICEDISFTNAWWARRTKMDLKTLNLFESMVLGTLNYKVNISSTDTLLTSIYEKCFGGVYF